MDMNPNEFKNLTSTSWDKKYKILALYRTKDKYTVRSRLGLNSIIVPEISPF